MRKGSSQWWIYLTLIGASFGCVFRPSPTTLTMLTSPTVALPPPVYVRVQWQETLQTLRQWDPRAALIHSSPDSTTEYWIAFSSATKGDYVWSIQFTAAGTELRANNREHPPVRMWYKVFESGDREFEFFLYKLLTHATRLRIQASPLGPSSSCDYSRDKKWIYVGSSSETLFNEQIPKILRKNGTYQSPAQLSSIPNEKQMSLKRKSKT